MNYTIAVLVMDLAHLNQLYIHIDVDAYYI